MDHHIKALEAMLAEGMTQEGVVETTKALAQCKIAAALERIADHREPQVVASETNDEIIERLRERDEAYPDLLRFTVRAFAAVNEWPDTDESLDRMIRANQHSVDMLNIFIRNCLWPSIKGGDFQPEEPTDEQ